MNNVYSFNGRLPNSPISRIAAIMLIALAWSSIACCNRNHDAETSGELGMLRILYAARLGNSSEVQVLLKKNPNLVFSKNKHGKTALHEAAGYGGSKDVVELLLAYKAKVNASDNNGATPLQWASIYGNKDVVESLLAHKAEVNATTRAGHTPLHAASVWGYKDVVESLLAHKAEVNAKDNNGETPLHYAAVEGYKDVVELLLAHKAEVNAKDNNGNTPLLVAVQKGHKDVVELLCQHGGHE